MAWRAGSISFYLSTKLSRKEMLQNCTIMLISTPAEIRALFRKRKLAILHKMFYCKVLQNLIQYV
jgi:hypothetical protein